MSAEFYKESMVYEAFIRRAHKCERQRRHGASNSFMQNLMRAEAGRASVNHLPGYGKQLETVKSYMDKALGKFLKRKLTDVERSAIENLKDKLAVAHATSELMQILDEGLATTDRFKAS